MPVQFLKRRGLPPADSGELRRRAARLLQTLDLAEAELSILLVGDAEMTELNRCYRGRERTTDVLAFSQREGRRPALHPEVLGDVVICVPAAGRQAQERGHDLLEELTVLLVHGVLHLLGREHERVGRRAAAAMRREQERLVALLGSGKIR